MKYQHVYTEVFRKPWAILPEKLHIIAEIVSLRASGEKFTEKEIRARLGAFDDDNDDAPARIEAAGPRSVSGSRGLVAVIPVYGVISQRMNLMTQISGGTSTEKLTAQLRAALADVNVSSIVMDVDSPGGGVDGVPELAAEILAGRAQKKIIAVANTMAASAAYWLACSASEVIVTPSGSVGSIGVFCEHEDASKYLDAAGVKVSLISAGKYKTEGNPYEPLSDEARAAIQSDVDSFYEMFLKAVARGRGVSQASVRGGFGQGRMVMADDAVKQGMADRVATLDETLGRMGVKNSSAPVAAESAAARMAFRRRELDLHR